MAETRDEAHKIFNRTLKRFEAKYPKAMACLAKDRDELLAFYDYPAEHWVHIRTTNPIESTFATVRLRTKRSRSMTPLSCLSDCASGASWYATSIPRRSMTSCASRSAPMTK